MVLYPPTPTRRAFPTSAVALAARVVLPVSKLRNASGTLLGAALILLTFSSGAPAEGDARRGAQVYRACVACHALEPDLHLSGPSLDGFMGRMAGTAEGFVRYSTGLKEAGFSWNADALDGWLKDPAGMIPDTYMTFRGIDDPQARADLVAFLEIAGQPGGGKKVVGEGLIPAAWLRAGAPEPIGDPQPEIHVTAIRHCGDSYFITTGDGRETAYWEKNIRLKIDSVETGPPAGTAVILGAGMGGDRFSVIFPSLSALTNLVTERCEAR
ncbi:c-type cytochrome [Chelativorans sp. M5D2P16]|uniref:c-type cytochrome n=1 Tax=Chelativorans sp. M5D2P16 TaxID=3095678 RepID=UPI002ACA2953|nr:c-type cytochrome [Chelativorans sp. M5D2P16]MDZ5697082.1 c-type cytochrome [Chelativorans sp. M5D2P16]